MIIRILFICRSRIKKISLLLYLCSVCRCMSAHLRVCSSARLLCLSLCVCGLCRCASVHVSCECACVCMSVCKCVLQIDIQKYCLYFCMSICLCMYMYVWLLVCQSVGWSFWMSVCCLLLSAAAAGCRPIAHLGSLADQKLVNLEPRLEYIFMFMNI